MAKREYMAFLLRLWRENNDGTWRALLENPHNGERAGFATLAELVTFLEDKTGATIQQQVISTENSGADAPTKLSKL